MGEAIQAPGLFGKLPSHGDFLVRRLPPAVRLCFDHWLQAGLVQSRIDLGDAWLPAWLGSPLWRFVAAPGVCAEQAWAGVMMPSHDRVGRCFPLLLMVAVDGRPSLADCLTLHAGWFERLEAMALSTLEEGVVLEAFDAALTAVERLPAPACAMPAAQDGLPSVRLFAGGEISAGTGSVLAAGASAWWTDGSHQVAPCMATCSGLPPRHLFAALLDGSWTERGWRII